MLNDLREHLLDRIGRLVTLPDEHRVTRTVRPFNVGGVEGLDNVWTAQPDRRGGVSKRVKQGRAVVHNLIAAGQQETNVNSHVEAWVDVVDGIKRLPENIAFIIIEWRDGRLVANWRELEVLVDVVFVSALPVCLLELSKECVVQAPQVLVALDGRVRRDLLVHVVRVADTRIIHQCTYC